MTKPVSFSKILPHLGLLAIFLVAGIQVSDSLPNNDLHSFFQPISNTLEYGGLNLHLSGMYTDQPQGLNEEQIVYQKGTDTDTRFGFQYPGLLTRSLQPMLIAHLIEGQGPTWDLIRSNQEAFACSQGDTAISYQIRYVSLADILNTNGNPPELQEPYQVVRQVACPS